MAGENGFFMSLWSAPRIHFTWSLSRSTNMRKILSSRDASVMIWMFPVFTSSCSVTLAFSCFNGRLDSTVLAGKFTRMRPSPGVVEDSVDTVCESFQESCRQPFVARDLEFYHQLSQKTGLHALLEPVATWMIQLRVGKQTRAHMLSTSQRLRLCLWSVRLQASSPSVPREGSPTSVSKHARMIAMSMAQRLSSIPIGAPGFVTKSNTLLQSMTLMAKNRWMYVSLFFRQNVGNKTVANMHMIHSRCPNPKLNALASPAGVDVHPCFSSWDFLTTGAHGATCPAPIAGSAAPIMYPTLRSSSPVFIFRVVVSVYHESAN